MRDKSSPNNSFFRYHIKEENQNEKSWEKDDPANHIEIIIII